MNFLINETWIKALSWTLIHSLWLGLAAAILAALILLLTKKATSTTRYNLLAGLAVVFLVTIGFIFYNEFETPAPVTQAGASLNTNFQPESIVSSAPVMIREKANAPLSMITSFISEYGSWIVLIWLVVLLFKSIRMTFDLRQVYRARNYQTSTPPEGWQKRVSELQVSLQIKRSVQLLESKLVTIPSVAGFFKPVILMPVGLLNNIPQDQVEAILLHELAHIRRSDYVINLLQTFLEILFFFNPGILWISSLLKDERENCCDDLAISVTNNKKEFVNALISFQEHHLHTQRFALQFSNQKMKLADRAKRILFNNNKLLSIREKYFLSVSAAVSAILFLVVLNVNNSSAQELKSPVSDTAGLEPVDWSKVPEDSSFRYVDSTNGKKSLIYVFKKDGMLYQVSENLEHLQVNGQTITGKDREKYLPQMTELIADYEQKHASEKIAYVEGEYPEVDLSEEERIIDETSKIIDAHSAIIDQHSATIDKYAAIIDEQAKIIEAEANKKSGEIDWKKHDAAQRRIEEEQAKIEIATEKINQQARQIDELVSKIDEQSRKIDAKLKLQQKELDRIAGQQEAMMQNLMDDLKKAGYNEQIKSLELNEKSLIINGKTQSEALFREVKKYLTPGSSIFYNRAMH